MRNEQEAILLVPAALAFTLRRTYVVVPVAVKVFANTVPAAVQTPDATLFMAPLVAVVEEAIKAKFARELPLADVAVSTYVSPTTVVIA